MIELIGFLYFAPVAICVLVAVIDTIEKLKGDNKNESKNRRN